MKERITKLRTALVRSRTISAFQRITLHVRRLPPGDRFIIRTLGVLILVLAFASLYTLERQFLVEVPSNGGTLTEGVIGSPRFINPLLAITDADRDLASLTYAGLMGYDENGILVPVLAESYEISEDGKTYTFRLREHLRFSNGLPVTAEDVVYTVEKAQDPGLKSPELANWSNIRAEVVDARTVRFTLPKAYAPFLRDATLGILPAKIWRSISNEEFPFSPYVSEPVGAGAFKTGSMARSKNGSIERYELIASNNYALGKPHLSKITFLFFPTIEDVSRAYDRGRIESAYGLADTAALRAPYSRVFGVFFNQNQNPLFARIEVRKALSLATDRPGLVQNVLGGFATPLYGPVPPAPGLALPEERSMTTEERLREATTVLEASGWAYDGEAKIWKHKKDSLELSVTLKTSNVPELKAIAEHLRTDWARLGVPVSLEFYESSELAQEVIRPRQFGALLFGMVVGRDPNLFPFWESSQRNDPGLNIAMYANHAVDELLEKLQHETDGTRRREDLVRVNNLIAADYPAIFTHTPDFLYTVPKGLKGVVLADIASPSDRLATAAFWYRHSEFVWPVLAPQ